jgi:hypothetical protein
MAFSVMPLVKDPDPVFDWVIDIAPERTVAITDLDAPLFTR